MINDLLQHRSGLLWMKTEHGLVFTGLTQADEDNINEAKDYFGEHVKFDILSFPGRYAREYTAKIWVLGETTTEKLGGEGSHTYETQNLGAFGGGDIEFMPEDKGEIWHRNPEGEKVYGELNYPKTLRGYHRNMYGEAAAGPRPGSIADELLGDGSYEWDEEHAWWVIV